jgi:hypothetical protein
MRAAELWGGPLDGEQVECYPAPMVVTALHNDNSNRVEWTPFALHRDAACRGENYHIVGVYSWTTDRRLTWSPHF